MSFIPPPCASTAGASRTIPPPPVPLRQHQPTHPTLGPGCCNSCAVSHQELQNLCLLYGSGLSRSSPCNAPPSGSIGRLLERGWTPLAQLGKSSQSRLLAKGSSSGEGLRIGWLRLPRRREACGSGTWHQHQCLPSLCSRLCFNLESQVAQKHWDKAARNYRPLAFQEILMLMTCTRTFFFAPAGSS